MALVSDRERERATAALRRQYLHGRLSSDQLADRVGLALRARDTRALRSAFRGLPPVWRDGDELRRLGNTAKRGALLTLLLAGWLLLSLVLLVAFALTALVHGVSTVDAVVFPGAWLVASAFVWRAARRT